MSERFDFEKYIIAQARSVSRTCGLDPDDVAQELRLCRLKIMDKPEPVQTLAIKRQCIDLMRVEFNRRKHFINVSALEHDTPTSGDDKRSAMLDLMAVDRRRELRIGSREPKPMSDSDLLAATDSQETAVRATMAAGNYDDAAKNLGITYAALTQRITRFRKARVEFQNYIERTKEEENEEALERR